VVRPGWVERLRQAMTFVVLRGNDAKGGMRFAITPYGARCELDKFTFYQDLLPA
jgi:hypothetical protein